MGLTRHRPALIATGVVAIVLLLALNWAWNIARRDFAEQPTLVEAPAKLVAKPVAKVPPITLLEGEVGVSAEVRDEGFWAARIEVKGPNASFSSESYGFASINQTKDEFIASLRAQTNWKNGVLFVPHSCGGGNAWRCDLHILYRVNEGRLVEIGSVEQPRDGQSPGTTLNNGLITDTFDLLENNRLTSHAAAPSFTLVLRVTPESLVPDLERTLDRNVGMFQANQQRLACEGPPCEPVIDPEERASMALHDAALAKYCFREFDLPVVLAIVRKALDDQAYKAFEKDLALVEPGELMTAFDGVRRAR